MKTLRPFSSEPVSNEQVDRSLRDLLGSTPPPQLHQGFDRRLARAIEEDRTKGRNARRVHRIMWGYWTVAALISIAIVWRLGSPLPAGPGLWLGIGGAVSLTFAALSFVILTPLPLKSRRRAPGP
jgi:hypothetical protein